MKARGPLTIIAVLLALACGPSLAAAAPSATHQAEGGTGYWTSARIAAAEPRDISVDPGAIVPGLSPLPSGAAGERSPSPTPSGFGGGPGTTVIDDPTAYPAVTTGKVVARDSGGGYSCSATVVTSKSKSVLFTAAHCVRTKQFGWAKRFTFIPAYDEGNAPYGRWSAKVFYLPKDWERVRYDYAAVVLAKRNGKKIEDEVGAAGFTWNGSTSGDFRAFGYPGNIQDGERMIGCLSEIVDRDGGNPAPVGIECEMEGGASGGGWLNDEDQLASVTSYGYVNRPGLLYGPYLTSRAIKLLRKAEKR